MKRKSMLLLMAVILFSSLLGFFQIAENLYAVDRIYCDQGYYTNYDCVSSCGWSAVKACLLIGGEYRCCYDRITEEMVCLGCFAE